MRLDYVVHSVCLCCYESSFCFSYPFNYFVVVLAFLIIFMVVTLIRVLILIIDVFLPSSSHYFYLSFVFFLLVF